MATLLIEPTVEGASKSKSLTGESKRPAATVPAPNIAIETKFMQNYRIASPVNAGGSVEAVANGNGQVEMFTVGTDGQLWNVYPDPTSDTGYSFVEMPIPGATVTAIAAGTHSNGSIVIFVALAGNSNHIYYMYETGTGSSRWSPLLSIGLPPPPSGSDLWDSIDSIEVQEIGGSLYVAVICQKYSVATPLLSTWNMQSSSFIVPNAGSEAPLVMAWIGNDAASAAFAATGASFGYIPAATGTVDFFGAIYAGVPADDLTAVTDSSGNPHMFSIQSGLVYQLGPTTQPDYQFQWNPIPGIVPSVTYTQLAADIDSAGTLHVFALGSDSVLYHWESSTPNGQLMPLYPNVGTFTEAGNDNGAIDVFAVGTALGTLTHLYQQEATSDWVTASVEVANNGSLETYISYSTDLSFTDNDGAPLVAQLVNVWASEECQVTVNGGVYYLGPTTTQTLPTNGAGILSIAQATDALAVPTLYAALPGQSGDPLALEQYAQIQATFGTVTGNDLMNAQDSSGYLIPEADRNQSTCDALAAAFNQCILDVGPTPSTITGAGRRRRARLGVYLHPAGKPFGPRRVAPPADAMPWQFSFADGQASFRMLTRDEAATLVAERKAKLPRPDGIFDWVDDVGDFFEDVYDGLVEVVEVVVTPVANAIEAAFTFVFEGVEYLFDATIDFVEQAFGVIEAFFAAIEVTFEEIFEWLGFIFDWDDIVRTHQAMVYTLNQYGPFLTGAASGLQSFIDENINNFQTQITTIFNQAIQSIGGSTIGGYTSSNAPPDPTYDSASSNNVVLNGFLNNLSGITTSPVSPVPTGELQAFITQLTDFIDLQEAGEAWQQATQYFTNLSGSPDQVLTQLLSGLLKAIEALLQAIISGVQAVVDALLQLVGTLVQFLQGMLTDTWDIPLVSELYSSISGGAELSALDLVCLIAAVPATILYKIAYDAPPFPDASSVAAFESSFSAQTMLESMGFGTAAGSRKSRERAAAIPAAVQTVLNMFAAAFTGVYGFLAALIDGTTVSVMSPQSAQYLAQANWATYLSGIGSQLCTNPCLSSPDQDPPNCTTTSGKSSLLWIYQTGVGGLLDLAFLEFGDRLPETHSDVGVCATLIYGSAHLGLAVMATLGGPGGDAAALNILPTIPELFKYGLLQEIVVSSGGVSPLVVAATDFGLGLAQAGIMAADAGN